MDTELAQRLAAKAVDVVVAFVNRNTIAPEELPTVLQAVHGELMRLAKADDPAAIQNRRKPFTRASEDH